LGLLRESEICVASDRSRVANISTEHLKYFKSNFDHGPNFQFPPAGRPTKAPLPVRPIFCLGQSCIRAIPSRHPTILARVLTPIGPAQCPILYCNFRVIIHQVQTMWSNAALPRNNSRRTTGSRTALNSTCPLSRPSAGVFLESVQLKIGKFMFRILNLTVLIAILYSILPQPASAVSSARECLGRLSRNGHLMNMIGRLPTKKSRLL
jgi:hypothetical protein